MPTAHMRPAKERKDAAADASDTAAKIDAFLLLRIRRDRGAPSPRARARRKPEKSNKKLDEQHIASLDALGFDWRLNITGAE